MPPRLGVVSRRRDSRLGSPKDRFLENECGHSV